MPTENPQAPLVRLQDVSKRYRMGSSWVTPFSGVSLEVQPGEFLALAGSSGSGKTTLLNLIGGIDVPTTGTVVVDNIPLHLLLPRLLAEFRAVKVGFIFQTFNLIPTLSAVENVEYPLMLLGHRASERRAMAREALETVGLGEQIKHKPGQLSGGQRQRVAIARALVKNPKLILADEPTANLDARTATEILELMQKLNSDLGTTFIFSTHDNRILQKASRIYWVGEPIEEVARGAP